MIGDIIQAVGAIAGGVAGGAKHDSAGDQLRSTVNAARSLGISPLAALGGSTSWGPVNPMGDAVANAGAALGRAFSKDPNADLNAQLLKSQIAANNAQAADYLSSARSRTLLAAARAASTGGPVVTSNDSIMTPVGRFKLDKSDPASKVQNELGDWAESAYGLWRTVNSAYNNNFLPYLMRMRSLASQPGSDLSSTDATLRWWDQTIGNMF